MCPGGGVASYVSEFWLNQPLDLVDATTVHIYSLITNSKPAPYSYFYNATILNLAREQARASKAATPWDVPMWVGEGSPDWRVTGDLGHNITFESAYVDMAASIALEGGQIFARQCLNSVVNPGEDVQAGYWVMLLWKRLMGRAVYNVTVEGVNKELLRAYCHTNMAVVYDSQGTQRNMTILLINLAEEATFVNLGEQTCATRDEYHVRGVDGNTSIYINNKIPKFQEASADLPTIQAIQNDDCKSPVEIAPRSFSFIVLKP